MFIKVLDYLGVKTGVKIDNVRAEYDDSTEIVKIYGKLYKMENYTKKRRRVRIMCDIIDKDDRLLISQNGKIFGEIDILDKVSFSIIIKNFTLVDWKETSSLKLYII